MIIGSDKSLLHNIFQFCTPRYMYCQTYIVSCTKSLNLNISCLVLQLSLPNPLKPGVNVIMVTTAVSGRLRLTFTMTVTGRLPFPFTTAIVDCATPLPSGYCHRTSGFEKQTFIPRFRVCLQTRRVAGSFPDHEMMSDVA